MNGDAGNIPLPVDCEYMDAFLLGMYLQEELWGPGVGLVFFNQHFNKNDFLK